MRKIIILFCFSIISVYSFTSCLVTEYLLLLALTGGETFDDEMWVHYEAKVELVDAVDGHNLVAGIPLMQETYVKDSQYQLMVDCESQDINIYGLSYEQGYMGVHPYIGINFSLSDYMKSAVTYRLQCPYIFGDDRSHVFSIEFEKEHYLPCCLSFSTEDPRIVSWEIDSVSCYLILYVNPMAPD